LGRLPSAVAAAVVTVPVWWALGLDQGVWLAVGLALGGYAVYRRDVHRAFALLAAAFVGVALLSGILSAEGLRWITLARNLLIISAFFGAVLGVTALARQPRALFAVLASLAAFLTISAALSVLAFALQKPVAFTTLIAPLVPDEIASTTLGATSLTERSLATTSYALPAGLFTRPRGLFLFSTSEAVALSIGTSLMLALAGWLPRWRTVFIAAAGLAFVALLATTSRAPVGALALAGLLVWFARRVRIGNMRIEIRLTRPVIAAMGASVVAVLTIAVATGLAQPVIDVLWARSGDVRAVLYEQTIDRWAQRPVLGWGTEVDIAPTPTPVPTPTPLPTPTLTPPPPSPTPGPTPHSERPPAGSHSQYLGVLFKQGLVGLVLFLGLAALPLRRGLELFMQARPGSDLLLVGLLTALAAGVAEELWLDPATAVVVASVWGVALGYRPDGGPPGERGDGQESTP